MFWLFAGMQRMFLWGEGNSLKQLPKISTFSCAFFGPGIAKVENCFWRTCWPFRSADSFVQVQLSRVMESSEMLGTCEKRERECRQLFGCGYHGGSSLQIWNFFKRWSFSKSSLAQRHSTYITGGRSHLRILISVSWMTHIRCGNCAFFFCDTEYHIRHWSCCRYCTVIWPHFCHIYIYVVYRIRASQNEV